MSVHSEWLYTSSHQPCRQRNNADVGCPCATVCVNYLAAVYRHLGDYAQARGDEVTMYQCYETASRYEARLRISAET